MRLFLMQSTVITCRLATPSTLFQKGRAMRNAKALTACILVALACAGCGGGGATVKTTTTTVSIGQQLIDLQNSYKSGAMNEKQYEKARDDLTKRALAN